MEITSEITLENKEMVDFKKLPIPDVSEELKKQMDRKEWKIFQYLK